MLGRLPQKTVNADGASYCVSCVGAGSAGIALPAFQGAHHCYVAEDEGYQDHQKDSCDNDAHIVPRNLGRTGTKNGESGQLMIAVLSVTWPP
jgi:hypothetical protein